MKPLTKHKLLFHSPSSLRGTSWFGCTNELPLRFIKSLRATKQSHFTHQLTKVSSGIHKNHNSANLEQGDCFVDAATMDLVDVDLLSQLRLAMTKCSGYGLNGNFRPLTNLFKD
jgi:hypothetical protein